MDLSEGSKHRNVLVVHPQQSTTICAAQTGETNQEAFARLLQQLSELDLIVHQVHGAADVHTRLLTLPVDLILYDVGSTRQQIAAHRAHRLPDESDTITGFTGDSTSDETTFPPETITDYITRFITQLRADKTNDRLPVIAIGKQDEPALRQWAIRAGAVDYLPYSANRMEIMRTIELASPRQDAIAAEVQRQVQERYHDIIGMIQHEFRTPMTLLLGYGEYLRDALQSDIDPDEVQLSVEAILSGSERLNRLIESFLQLSELQFRQANDLKLQTVMPATLWREVQAILRTEAEAAGLEIIHEAPDEIPLALVDAELVREALIRLLDNALRYVRPESREVRLGVAYDGDWICWSIEDQGPGMDAEQLRRVLEPFERGERDLSKPQSLGLSLAIIKRIAELHDGKLHVTSQVDGGSQFVLQLPYRSPAETG